MQIWFYKATYGDWWDKLISWWTWGPYSHVELRFSDGQCFSSSSRDGGVRFKVIPLTERWTIVNLSTEDDEVRIKNWCQTQVGKKYDWLGAISCGMGLPWLQSDNKWFCSEIVAYALKVEHLSKMTPNKLYKQF